MRIQDYGDLGFTRMLQVIPAAAVFDHDEDYASGLDAMLSGLHDVLTECRRLPPPGPISDHSAALASPQREAAAD